MNICYSGGAKGADTLFGTLAKEAGHEVKHFRPKDVTEEIAKIANIELIKANGFLNRTYPTSEESVNNLLRRNYLQIYDTERIYAVTYLNENRIPKGGTAWAVVMGINMNIKEIYVFDQPMNAWFIWAGFGFIEIHKQNIPRPSGKYTGIGSRILIETGKQAIKELYAQP
jgi:hypothetical protein